MLKAVFDSTVLVSAFLGETGIYRDLLHQAEAGSCSICVSEEILTEIERVLLEYPRIRKRYRYADEAVKEYVALLRVVSQVITQLPKIKPVVRDPNDEMVVACASKASADYIVIRDKDLMTLGSYKGIRMVSPEEFLRLLKERA
jgi:putative PIN family toxin of toxin-antitoxin system